LVQELVLAQELDLVLLLAQDLELVQVLAVELVREQLQVALDLQLLSLFL
jgi:hypothetical protein